jgi:dTDP-4-dehydrorhamnose reductase
MNNKNAFLVVGADSLVGTSLLKAFEFRGHKAFGTTRRKETLSESRLFLDFESPEPFVAPPDVSYTFVVAAATNYERCEKDPQARVINEELTPRLIANLLGQGIFVTFISTNSIFGGEVPWPHEESDHDPQIPYAIQKHEAENNAWELVKNLNAEDRFNIVRLTKILDRSTPPLPDWFDAWQRTEPVTPFADLIFAPMSVQYVGEALATLGEKRIPGELHLSGSKNVNYVTFAEKLAEVTNTSTKLIEPTTAREKGVNIPYNPQYSGLGMERTTNLSGLKPQTLESVVSDLSKY